MSGAEGAKPVKIYIQNASGGWDAWDGAITTGDIEIGAVEIKDHDGTDRLEITSDNAARIDPVSVADNPESFEDTSFVTGDSPVTLDLNTALGRNATKGYIINDGAGNFTVAFSTNGTDFGDVITIKENEKITFSKISVDSLKITWIADSAYRVAVI